MLHVFAVHGIGVVEPYARAWARCLELAIAAEGVALAVRVYEGRWPTTGSKGQDLALTLASSGFRRDAVDEVAEALQEFDDDTRDVRGRRVLVGHSMGQVYLCAALRRAPLLLPVVTIGGPLTHPVWARGLATVGLARPCPNPVEGFYNLDDGICSARLPLVPPVVVPSWIEGRRVAVAGSDGYAGEHDGTDYLANRHVARSLAGLPRLM